MNILKIDYVNSYDIHTFYKELNRSIRIMQNDSMEVEVQYSTCGGGTAPVMYSALLIGREK